MKKKHRIFILVFLFFMLFVTVVDYNNNDNLRSDSGWDSGYSGGGGGGSSGGGSWSGGGGYSSHSSRSGRSSGPSYSYDPEAEAYGFAMMGIIFLVVIMISIALSFTTTEENQERNKKMSKYEEFMANYDSIIDSLENNTPLDKVEEEEIKELLPNETRDSLLDKLTQKFIDVQNAWMNFDYDALKNLCSDELFNTYKAQLDTLKLKNGQNIMSNFRPIFSNITSLKVEDGLIIIKMFLKISFFDYVIDTKTQKVIRGNKSHLFNNLYNLEYIIGKDDEEHKCPNCGAKVENVTAGKCKYCGAPIVVKPRDYVLNRKNIIK